MVFRFNWCKGAIARLRDDTGSVILHFSGPRLRFWLRIDDQTGQPENFNRIVNDKATSGSAAHNLHRDESFSIYAETTMKTVTSLMLTLLAAAGWMVVARAQTVESMLGRIPETANYVAVVNNQAILQTPRAVREGWSKSHEMEYLEGAIPVPPSVQLVVMGSQMNSGALVGNWGLAVFTLRVPMNMRQIAERQGGQLERFGDWFVAVTPRGYIIELINGVHGLMVNGTRQDFSRWVKNYAASRKPQVNDYLKQVIADSKSEHVAVAIDLEDMVDPAKLQGRLSLLKSLSGKSAEQVESLKNLLASIKGLRITVKIGDRARTTLRLDFNKEIGDQRDLLKPALVDLVRSMGASIPEFERANWQYESRAAMIQADLSDGSLARLMTVALLPMHANDPPRTATEAGLQQELELVATRRYYRAIVQLLDDIERQSKNATNYTSTALWHENFAAKMDQLPQVNVDPDMVSFGYDVATGLRSIAGSLRGVPIKVNAAAAGLDVRAYAVPLGYRRVYYRGWRLVPYYGAAVGSNSADVAAKQAEAIASDKLAARRRVEIVGRETASNQPPHGRSLQGELGVKTISLHMRRGFSRTGILENW